MLYLVMILSMFHMIQYLCINDTTRILIFIACALITKYFTSNMILILGIPLILSVFTRFIYTEGFTEKDATAKEKKEDPTKDLADTQRKKAAASDTKTQPDIIVPLDEAVDMSSDTKPTTQAPELTADSENYENRINYASTLSNNIQSYRDILGKDAFLKMTEDTKELLKQQDELGKSIRQFTPIIEKMTPFLSQATGLLNRLEPSKIKEMSKNIKKI